MKTNHLTIRNMTLGEGKPKICIPIVGQTEKEIYEQAKKLLNYPVDMVEWRADWFADLQDQEALQKVLKELRNLLGELPLLFTIRTAREGGEAELTREAYQELNRQAAKSGQVDLIDVELFSEAVSHWDLSLPEGKYCRPSAGYLGKKYQRETTQPFLKELQQLGVKVIGSSHDFEATPDKYTLLDCLRAMQELGPDICKLAVMPGSREDAAALLTATWEMCSRYADRPVITMSMGKLGLISRLAGETFGSAVTFGSAGQASAPGQIGADQLAQCLELLHGEAEPAGDALESGEPAGHIFLIGFMGAGKSTVAAALKERLGRKQIEMDARIEEEAGQTIASMFEQYGEKYFRDKETDLLLSLEKEEPAVISCGGGVVVREENTKFMKAHGRIVLLTAAPETVLERVKDCKDRPILNGNMNVEFIRGLQEKRRGLYESVADLTVATDGKTVEEICHEILDGQGNI